MDKPKFKTLEFNNGSSVSYIPTNKKTSINDMPSEVIDFKLQASFGFVGYTLLNEMIEKYPEWFQEEVEHRRKWDSIPQETKDEYFNTNQSLEPYRVKTHEQIGEAPFPELLGLGIIGRIEHYNKPNFREIEDKHLENEKWSKKLHEIILAEDIKLYNKLFNEYGLSK